MNYVRISSLQDAGKVGSTMIPPREYWPTDWFQGWRQLCAGIVLCGCIHWSGYWGELVLGELVLELENSDVFMPEIVRVAAAAEDAAHGGGRSQGG